MLVAACGFFSALCLLAMDLFATETNPYVGILTYMVAPGVVATGVAMMVFGAWLQHRHGATVWP